MITWEEYLVESAKTAIYDEWCEHNETRDVVRATYSVLGLIGELGELEEIVPAVSNMNDITKEIGDIFWYFADISRHYNIEFIVPNENVMDQLYLLGWHDLSDIVRRESMQVLQVCNISKKTVRDYEGLITHDYSVKTLKTLQPMFNRIVFLCYYFFPHEDHPFEYVLELNLDKLFSRQERGVLRGDGDNR